MKISLAVCTHNEGHYVKDLLGQLVEIKRQSIPDSFEIIVVDDFSIDPTTLFAFKQYENDITVTQHALNNDFSTHKNFLNGQCSADWILNLDADERLPDGFLDNLHLILEANPLIDAYWLPRVNVVDNLTLEHVRKWGWVISSLEGFTTSQYMPQLKVYELLKAYDLIVAETEDVWITYKEPIVQWPDPQMRLYRNRPEIRWEGKVHEQLTGYSQYSMFPHDPQFAIIHRKTISRQEVQNAYYSTLQR